MVVVGALGRAGASTTGLVAAYSFDEGAGTVLHDASGNGNNGTIANATWTGGKYGDALSFNGSNSVVTIPASASLDPTGAVTVEAWVRPDTVSSWRAVAVKEQTSSSLSYGLYSSSNAGPAALAYTSGEKHATTSSSLPTAAWSHIAAVYNGSALSIYVNGVLSSQTSVTGKLPETNGALTLGGDTMWNEWFKGAIDDLRVYNRALAASEIQSDMATPVGAPQDTTPPSTPGNVAVTSATQTALTVSWTASSDNTGVAGYDVSFDGAAPVTTTGTSFTVSGLTCGTTHTFTVDAYDAAGNRSAQAQVTGQTAACTDTQPPSVPPNQRQAGATQTTITFAWDPSTDNVGVAGYRLYLNGAYVASTQQTSYTYTGLQCGTTYTVGLEAYDAAGNTSDIRYATGPMSTAACTTAPPSDTQPPSTPASLTAYPTASGATLTWAASSDNVGVSGYDVAVDGGTAATTTSTSYTLTGLACNTAHTATVDAFDAAGNHSSKASVSFTTSACTGGGSPSVYVSPGGSDANPCTQSAPCATFDRAYHVASPGAIVQVAGGTYPGQTLTADSSKSSATSDVVFQPAAGASVTVNGELRFSSAQHVELDSMTVGDYYVGVNSPSGAGQTKDITLRNMSVRSFTMRSVDGLRLIGGSVGSITGGCGSGCTPFPGTTATSGSAEPIIGAVYCGGGGCTSSTPQSSNVLIDGVDFHDIFRVKSSGVHSACLWISSVTGLTMRNSTFERCDSQTIHMTYEPSYSSAPDGTVSKDVLIENNFMDPPTDNGGTESGANDLTWRYDNVQGNCLRNWVLRNNTIPGSVVLSSDLASQGCGVNDVVIGNIIGSFTDANGHACATGTLSNPIVFRYNVFRSMTCDSTDRSVNGGSFGLVNESGGDYHLTAGSVAVNLVPASAYSTPSPFAVAPPGPSSPTAPPVDDHDGQPRPIGSAFDAGADEAY
jgi:chitodextrinase